MVDLRPLLFINALLFMTLLTVGFAQVTQQNSYSGPDLPPLSVDNRFSPNKMAENNPRIAQTARQDKQSEPDDFDQITTANDSEADIFADVPSRVTSNDIQVKKHLDTVVESDPTGATNKPEARVITTTNKTSAKSKAEITGSVTMVVSNETERVSQPRSTTGDEESKPIAKKIEMEPVTFVKPKTPPVAKATTGKLIVRSNVNGDMVLINGKPYGKTKLEVNLKPGRYNVEVAKPGYVSWKGATNVYLGKSSALVASLEEYTSVEYRDGQWRGGISTGEGTYIESDGTEYTGSFVNKLFHGKGAIRYPDGIKYSGDWFEGKMHGQGSLTLANGDVYIGGFRDDQFNGDGTLTKANGDIFSGFWVKGALNGDGSLTTREGLLYVGGFADNLFHGQGDLTYPDGRHYDGSFSNGKYHGKGVETFADGKQYSGQFMDGTYHGHGEILNPNGSKISGTFKFGKPYGKAKLTTPEGEIFTARTNEPGVCYREKSYRATQCPPMEGW